MVDVDEKLQRFLEEELLYDQEGGVSSEFPLLKFLDSLGLLLLVSFIEEEFEVEVPDEGLTLEHFKTPEAVGRFVRSLAPSTV